jgi:hypothetical protein
LQIARQPLALNFQITRLFRNLEFLGIQTQDLGRVVDGVVLADGVCVVCAQRLVGARELG